MSPSEVKNNSRFVNSGMKYLAWLGHSERRFQGVFWAAKTAKTHMAMGQKENPIKTTGLGLFFLLPIGFLRYPFLTHTHMDSPSTTTGLLDSAFCECFHCAKLFCCDIWLWVKTSGTFFGVGYHPTIVFLKGFLGVHRGTGVLTHFHMYPESLFERDRLCRVQGWQI